MGPIGTGASGLAERPLLSREFIEQERRRGLIAAAAAITHEDGLRAATVARICAETRSARSTFYKLFPSAEHCLHRCIEEASERIFGPLRGGDPDGPWLLELDLSISRFYGAVAAHPQLANMLLVHSRGIDPRRADRALQVGIDALTAQLRRGHEMSGPERRELPPTIDELLAGVVISLATSRLRQARVASLPAGSREMTLLISSYFMGPGAAEKKLLDGGASSSPK